MAAREGWCMMTMERAIVLLTAARDMLAEIDLSEYSDVLSCTVEYDGTDCDGWCLLEDIDGELDALKAADDLTK